MGFLLKKEAEDPSDEQLFQQQRAAEGEEQTRQNHRDCFCVLHDRFTSSLFALWTTWTTWTK
jgi:hypothetical protein